MFDGDCACLAETRTKRPCSLAASWSWKARVVCWTVRIRRSWSRSQSASGASCSGSPAAPAADQVDEPVDPAEALDQRRAPAAHRLLVEQVDRAAVPALCRDRRARRPEASRAARGRASVRRHRRPSGPGPPPTRRSRRAARGRPSDPRRCATTRSFLSECDAIIGSWITPSPMREVSTAKVDAGDFLS